MKSSPRIIFITGTDTGVGKTLLTALLLVHLRQSGVAAFALKPFCSGNRSDPRLLYALQDGDLSLDQINPYFFSEPIAPLVAARKCRRRIPIQDVIAEIKRVTALIQRPGHQLTLLVEGAGGLLAPLGEDYDASDLIGSLQAQPIVASRNRLGTINHTLLTINALTRLPLAAKRGCLKSGSDSGNAGFIRPKLVLMEQHLKDCSAISNPRILCELCAPVRLFRLPFLGRGCCTPGNIRKLAGPLKHSLSKILA